MCTQKKKKKKKTVFRLNYLLFVLYYIVSTRFNA